MPFDLASIYLLIFSVAYINRIILMVWEVNLYHQIENLSESLNQVMAANEKITIELVTIRNVKTHLESRIINLEMLKSKTEEHNRWNKVETPGILNQILHKYLRNNVIKNCKKALQISQIFTFYHWDVTAPMIINVWLLNL